MPDKYPEFGQCVHKIVMHPARPERLFLQNHWGLYRSDNCAESWIDIANGVPSDFGFAMVTHPRNPDCVYIVPVESDEFRCACDGRLRVYRTRNGGASWEPLMRGLPQKRAYETVLRDAMTADSFDPVRNLLRYAERTAVWLADEGKTWQKILEGLPSVVCVRNAVVEDASGGSWQPCLRLRPACTANEIISVEEQDASSRRGDPWQSLFTFPELCANLPLDAAQSRSTTRPQLWPKRCRLSGPSIRACEIASQPSKGKCGNISIFSLGTKIPGIPADSRVLSPPGPRFRSSLLSVVAERIPAMWDHSRRRACPDLRFDDAREVSNEKPISGQPRLLPILGWEPLWLTTSPSRAVAVSSGESGNRRDATRMNRPSLRGPGRHPRPVSVCVLVHKLWRTRRGRAPCAKK